MPCAATTRRRSTKRSTPAMHDWPGWSGRRSGLADRVVERERQLQEALKRPVAAAVSTGIDEIYGQARRRRPGSG